MVKTWHDYEILRGGCMTAELFDILLASVVAVGLFAVWFSNDNWSE